MTKFTRFIYKLEQKGVITRKPRPAGVFTLAIIYLVFSFIVYFIHKKLHTLPLNILVYAIIGLTIFTFIFAILHWIVVRSVEKEEKLLITKQKIAQQVPKKQIPNQPTKQSL